MITKLRSNCESRDHVDLLRICIELRPREPVPRPSPKLRPHLPLTVLKNPTPGGLFRLFAFAVELELFSMLTFVEFDEFELCPMFSSSVVGELMSKFEHGFAKPACEVMSAGNGSDLFDAMVKVNPV